MLDRDLDEAEEQYQMALRNHLIHIDDLIALQQSRLRGLHEEFERDVKIIKEEFDREKADIEKSHELETSELSEMIATIEEEEKAKMKQINEDFLSEKERTRNMNVEACEKMKHDLIKEIEQLDNAFEVYFTRYMAETQTKTEQYSNLLQANTETGIEINKLTKQINRLQEQTAFWRLKTQQNYRECKDRDD